MGLIDVVKGLLGGSTVQDALESTGLAEHVEGFLGDGAGVAEALGLDTGQLTETITGAGDVLPGGLGEVVQGAVEGVIPETPLG